MKISRNWLQTYFEKPLPDSAALSDALTFHAFEIESIENDVLDVKVTPNRGHDCLSHRGIAKELSAILNVSMKSDPLRTPLPEFPAGVEMAIKDVTRAPVCAAAYVSGIKIGPSPAWLKERLIAIGQRSINNVVDATNYVMFDMGMPTHAFAADSFKDGDVMRYGIRCSEKGEKLALLGGTSIELSGQEAVIVNASGEAVDIGGVKGGMRAELQDDTTEVLLSASKFEPVQTRKAAQRFNQRTEAAKRFENEIADELALYGIRAVAELVHEVAGGEIVGYGIERTGSPSMRTVSVSLSKVNAVLGAQLGEADVVDVFKRLGLSHVQAGEEFTVTIPFERLDILIAEDLVEEVGRIIGYDKIAAQELPQLPNKPEVNANFYASERAREELVSNGYSEVFTSVFADKGERIVLNKVDGVNSYLRASLVAGLQAAFEKNKHNKDLLQLKEIRLFEIGTVWRDGKERMMLGTIGEKEPAKEVPLEAGGQETPAQYEDLPLSATTRYQTFSKYPFIVRDIALWAPDLHRESTRDSKSQSPLGMPEIILNVIRSAAGELLVRSELFDTFEKGDKISYAFRLIFQSFDKTLTDGDANERMESVNAAVAKENWQVR